MSVKDSFTTVTQTINIGTAFKLMHFKADGTAMAIGQTYDTSKSGVLQVGGNMVVNGTITGTVTNANKVKVVNEPNGKAWRRILFAYGTTAGNLEMRFNDGITHYSQDGTADALGYSYFQLGNGTAAGTAGNKKGRLRLYGNGEYYHQLEGNATANRTLTLPDKAGTIALTSDIPAQKSCMTICQTGRPNIQVSTAYATTNIPLDSTRGKIGTNLEYTTNGIKVLKNMAALISAQVVTWNSTESAEFDIRVVRNGSTDELALGFSHTREGGQIQHHVITPQLLSLNANDIIQLYFTTAAAGQYCFLGDTRAIYLTVQEL